MSALLSGFLILCVPFLGCVTLNSASPFPYICLLAVVSAHFWTIYKHYEQKWFETFPVRFLKISALLALALTHASGIKLTATSFESSLRGTSLVCLQEEKSCGNASTSLLFQIMHFIFLSILFYHILRNYCKQAFVPSTIMCLQFTSHL